MIDASLDIGQTFAQKIPGFNTLCQQDQRTLLQRSCLELFALRTAQSLDSFGSSSTASTSAASGNNLVKLPNNTVLHESQMSLVLGDWWHMLVQLGDHLKAMDIDETAFACLCALVVMSGE